MAESKRANGGEKGTAAGARSNADRTSGGGARGSSAAASSFSGKADQIGSLFSKGLELAEAGLSLGLTVIDRVGSVAQQKLFDGVSIGGASAPPTAPSHDTAAPGAAPAEPPPVSEPDMPVYCITNRLPLAPGGVVKISFSINNDSLTETKRVNVAFEGMVGESTGHPITPDVFVVKPARKSIAPMDFEKFVLQGSLVPETAADVYLGSVVVSSDESFQIPVRIVVAP